jgi:hypothetical protein
VTIRYICTGHVHPERADVSFSHVEIHLEGGGVAAASCAASQVTVTIDVPTLDGWIAAQIMAGDVAHLVVGALGFSLGSGYSVEIIQVTEPDGTPHVFGVRPKGENGETLGIDPYLPAFNRAIKLSARDIFFRLALRDYLRAINDVKDCATYCYRAIEGLKSAFVLKTGVDRWEDFHAALGTDRDEIKTTVKEYADPVRHGNWLSARSTDKFERWKMLSLTRRILIKYMDNAQPDA